MQRNESERIAILESNHSNMARSVEEIKGDVKDVRDDLMEIKLTIAKWSGAIIVVVSSIQIIINKFL